MKQRSILLRDPTDDRYPWLPAEQEAKRNPHRWRVVTFTGHHHMGIKFVLKSHFAYLDDERKRWDMVDSFDDSKWRCEDDDRWSEPVDRDLRERIRAFWAAMPEQNRATYLLEAVIPYEQILAIDDQGDEQAPFPHIYREIPGPILSLVGVRTARGYDSRIIHPDDLVRIKHFPDDFPMVERPKTIIPD